MSEMLLGFALVGAVLTISALVSGLVERAPLSFPIIFLGLGFVLGRAGVLEIDSHSQVLEVIAILSLALVLFLDALKVQIDELRNDWYVPMLSLGPGTLLIIALIGLAAYLIVGTSATESLLLGTILASTDPVVLRDVLRNEQIPRSVRRALSIEAGMNDIVVLPIVLVLIAVLTANVGGTADWIMFLGKLLILSPLAGLMVGGFGSWLMNLANGRYNIRQEYQALYGIGLVLAAFTTAQSLGGDGFLAAFFAGLAVTVFNMSLCDCFMEYGEVTSEMAMLFAFVLFGAVLATLISTVAILPALLLAIIAIGIVRPLAVGLVLQRATISNSARAFIGWFGPRGLNSLLLALLVVQADAPNAEDLLAITGIVVMVSVVAHGTSATPLSNWYGRQVANSQQTYAEERESSAVGLFQHDATETDIRVTPEQVLTMIQSDNPPLLLDVRARAHYLSDQGQIPGSVRVLPDHVEDWGHSLRTDKTIIAYCNCPDEATSGRAARKLRSLGFDAFALVGGYSVWEQKGYPVEPKQGMPVLEV